MPLALRDPGAAAAESPAQSQPSVDPRVVAAVRTHRQAGIAAIEKWHQAYMARNPGDMRMSVGNFSVATAVEAQRLRDGRPRVMGTSPESELAAMQTEKIRASLVKFLQDWGIVALPGAPEGASPSEGVSPSSVPSKPTPAPSAVGGAKSNVPDSPWPAASKRIDSTILPEAPWTIPAQPAAAVGTPAHGTPTTLYELIHATLHGAALQSALDVLFDRVRDPAIPLPSRQEVEAEWLRYLHGVSPARDHVLRAFFKHWGLLVLEQIGEPHDMKTTRR